MLIRALPYTDDVTLLLPSMCLLRITLHSWNFFAEDSYIYCNGKKTMCIKFDMIFNNQQ